MLVTPVSLYALFWQCSDLIREISMLRFFLSCQPNPHENHVFKYGWCYLVYTSNWMTRPLNSLPKLVRINSRKRKKKEEKVQKHLENCRSPCRPSHHAAPQSVFAALAPVWLLQIDCSKRAESIMRHAQTRTHVRAQLAFPFTQSPFAALLRNSAIGRRHPPQYRRCVLHSEPSSQVPLINKQ